MIQGLSAMASQVWTSIRLLALAIVLGAAAMPAFAQPAKAILDSSGDPLPAGR
jgi:hypothetical protein